jgi:hypothetical protein
MDASRIILTSNFIISLAHTTSPAKSRTMIVIVERLVSKLVPAQALSQRENAVDGAIQLLLLGPHLTW